MVEATFDQAYPFAARAAQVRATQGLCYRHLLYLDGPQLTLTTTGHAC